MAFRKGYFISFEGPEASGKTTQVNLLANYLTKEGLGVVKLKEPGGTRVGEALREILLSTQYAGVAPKAETLLYLASRAQLTEEVIWPSLEQGKVVITDRFALSTIAYQVYGRGLEEKVIWQMNCWATRDLEPDIIFYLRVPFSLSWQRSQRQDRLEQENEDFHRKVYDGYEDLALRFSDKVKVVDYEEGPKKVFGHVLNLLEESQFWEKVK